MTPSPEDSLNTVVKDAVKEAADEIVRRINHVADSEMQIWISVSHPDLSGPTGNEHFIALKGEHIKGLARKLKSPAKLDPHPPQDDTFIPRERQASILAALKGKALRTDALAHKIGLPDNSQLFRKHALKGLVDRGLVKNHPSLGYYSTQYPPPEMLAAADETADAAEDETN